MPLLQNSLYPIAERRKNGFRNYKKRKAKSPLAGRIPMSPVPYVPCFKILKDRPSELSKGVSKYPITHLIIHVTPDPCHSGSGHFLPCTLLNVFLICLNCTTTWHNVNRRRTQVAFKRPHYKDGSFPFGQWKGLGHILPWPCLGSKWAGKTGPKVLFTCCWPRASSPTLRHLLSEHLDCLSCFLSTAGPGRGCCPSHECTEHVSGGSRNASAWPCPRMAQGRACIHPTHLLSGCLGLLPTFQPLFCGMAGREQSSPGN